MADYLPLRELWPTRVYKLQEFTAYPERFNPTEELLEKVVADAGLAKLYARYASRF